MFVAYYRPQWSWAKVMFLQASVILSTGGEGSASVPAPLDQADPPRTRDPPTRQTSPRTRQTPGTRDPPTRQTPPEDQADPPPREADASIRSMSGRYASYWNAFLFFYICPCSLGVNRPLWVRLLLPHVYVCVCMWLGFSLDWNCRKSTLSFTNIVQCMEYSF